MTRAHGVAAGGAGAERRDRRRAGRDSAHGSASTRAGLPVFDLFDVYPGAIVPALRVAPWDDHPNAAGHQLIADRLLRELTAFLASGALERAASSRDSNDLQLEAASMDNTREVVQAFILDNFLPGEDPQNLTDDTELKESGILDSLSTLKLVTFLEEHFKIEFEADDLDAGNLSSVASIAQPGRHRRPAAARRPTMATTPGLTDLLDALGAAIPATRSP